MLTSLPTVAQPAGKCAATAAPEAISIARIIIGVPKTNGMPSTWAPTVTSRVTRTSCRPVIPARTFSSGSVIGAPSRETPDLSGHALEMRAPRSPEVDATEQEQPDDVDEMPVPGGELEPDMVARSELAEPGAQQAGGQENHADDDMRAVKAGGHEEGRAVDRVLEVERRVDVFVSLGEDEEHPQRDPERQKILELRTVPLAQIIVSDVDRRARGQQHERIHQRQLERVHHLGALRGPHAAAESKEAGGLRVGGIEGRPEERPEPGDEEHHLGGDEQNHANGQAMADKEIVVAALSLADDIAPPPGHGEQDARDADGQKRRAQTRVVHRPDEPKGREKREKRANDRPGARLDEMKSRPVRNRGVRHRRLQFMIIPPARPDRPSAAAEVFRAAGRTACKTA